MKHICTDIASVIKEHIDDRRYTFVFNSDIARSSWALRCVKEFSPVLDMERFLAWDEFIKRCTSPKTQSPAPSKAMDGTARRMFASALIRDNASSPFLEAVVPKAFASDALYLAPSIAKRLPALNLWKKLSSNASLDTPEMRDYKEIYDRYVSFMEKSGRFETSWQNAELDGGYFVLFYPSILEDWVQYEEALSALENVTVVDLPKDFAATRPKAHLYPNARMELRKTALHIRKILDAGEYASLVALTVPDLEAIRPYVERELRLYGIPFVTRIASPLSSSGIGRMFRAIYNCYADGFSLSSVRVLLQSCSVPWVSYNANGAHIDWATELVRIGSEMRCLCRWSKGRQKIDPWKAVFCEPKMERESVWYNRLKDAVASLVEAKDFGKMRDVWFYKWRDRTHGLLDDDAFAKGSEKYDKESDVIISRCITALYKLEQLEKDLSGSGIKIDNHYEFFLAELQSTLYTPQQEEEGINVFGYKVASCAAYKHNIVINASGPLVTVNYKTLGFLSEDCRGALLPQSMQEGLDVSKEFLTLYSESADSEISSSSNGFSGFSTPHSFLSIARDGKSCDTLASLDDGDFVTREKSYFVQGKMPSPSEVISARQMREANEWVKRLVLTNGQAPSCTILQSAVFENLGKGSSSNDPIKISATAMNKFFPCARKWLLNNALKLRDEETFDTDLMPDYSSGNILHKMLEIFCGGYMERKEPLPITAADGTFGEAEGKVQEQVTLAAAEAVKSASDNSHSLLSMPLVARAFELQTAGYVRRVMSFLHKVCVEDKRGKDGEINTYSLGGKYVEGVEAEKMLLCAPYALHGRIDCILNTADGGRIIIDYKSANPPEVKDSKVSADGEIADFQMPMYVALLSSEGEGGCTVEEAAFFHIGDGEAKIVVSPKAAMPFYEPTVSRLKDYAAHFAQRVYALDFSPADSDKTFAPLNIWEACIKCPFNSICRKTFTTSI